MEMLGMDAGIEAKLESGDVHVVAPPLPFERPAADDQTFLFDQELHKSKEIVFEPGSGRLAGFRWRDRDQELRLRRVLDECGQRAGQWLASLCPAYASASLPVRTCFHVAEEATRSLRITARNDLLHVDALHHAAGRRMLRLFVNLNPIDPRVWVTSDTLDKVLPRFQDVRSVRPTGPVRWGQGVLRMIKGRPPELHPYDETMLALSRAMKHSDEFQEKSPRRIWHFGPGQAWLAFTDGLVHADLRGRWVLDHLFLVPSALCVTPSASPESILFPPTRLRAAA